MDAIEQQLLAENTAAAQLALRHPEYAERPSALHVRKWILDIKQQIEEAGYPDLARSIGLGFHKRFDV